LKPLALLIVTESWPTRTSAVLLSTMLLGATGPDASGENFPAPGPLPDEPMSRSPSESQS
jgi:hypothetical protein